MLSFLEPATQLKMEDGQQAGLPGDRTRVNADAHCCVSQVVAVAALAVARAVAIWPAAVVINALRPPDLRIPQSQQFMIWFSGMRGAMAFAMVLRSLEDLPGMPPPPPPRALMMHAHSIAFLGSFFLWGA